MLTDEQIEALRPKVDICTTNIDLKRTYIFESGLKAVKYSQLMTHSRFVGISSSANKIYARMRDLGYLCPHIQLTTDYCQMDWTETTKIISIRIYLHVAEFAITYIKNQESKTIHCFDDIDAFVFALGALVDELESDDNRSSTIKRPLRSKIRPAIRNFSRFHRNSDGKQPPISSDGSQETLT